MSQTDPRRTDVTSTIAGAGAVDLSTLRARSEPPPPPSSSSPWVVDVTEQNFQAEVLERSLDVPVVVDLWATWCQPCKQLSPILEKLADEGGGTWVLAKVDVDANPRISQAFGVQSIPTVVAVVAGQPVDAFNGAMPEPQVKQWIDTLIDALKDKLPGIAAAQQGAAIDADADGNAAVDEGAEPAEPPEDPRFTAAEDALDRGDYDAAQRAYQAILDAEPDNEQAKAALAQVRFMARAEAADPAAIARADADPDDLDAQLAAADAELAADSVEAAFNRLVATVGRTTGEDRERVREHLLGLFDLYSPDDPRVSTARRALARVLF